MAKFILQHTEIVANVVKVGQSTINLEFFPTHTHTTGSGTSTTIAVAERGGILNGSQIYVGANDSVTVTSASTTGAGNITVDTSITFSNNDAVLVHTAPSAAEARATIYDDPELSTAASGSPQLTVDTADNEVRGFLPAGLYGIRWSSGGTTLEADHQFTVDEVGYQTVAPGNISTTAGIAEAAARLDGNVGVVFLGEGTYTVSAEVDVPVTIRGIGNGSVIKAAAGFSPAQVVNLSNAAARLENCRVDCSDVAGVIGVLVDGTETDGGIDNVSIIGLDGLDAVALKISGASVKDCAFRNITTTDTNSSSTAYAIQVASTGGNVLLDNIRTGGPNGVLLSAGAKCNKVHVECSGIGFSINTTACTILSECSQGGTGSGIGIQVQSGAYNYAIYGFTQKSTQTGLVLDENNQGSVYDVGAPSGGDVVVPTYIMSGSNGNLIVQAPPPAATSGPGPLNVFQNGVRVNEIATIASATALVLGDGNLFNVTGTTAITSITTSSADNGRIVVLKFNDTLTVSDGNNLKLSGDYETSTSSTLTLIGDGTNFYEIGRDSNDYRIWGWRMEDGRTTLQGGFLNWNKQQNLSNTSSLVTIDGSDTITVTRSTHVVAAASAGADSLATINGGLPGDMVLLTANSGDTITVVNSGNIKTAELLGDRVLNSVYDKLLLIRQDSTWWVEIAYSQND